MRSATAPRRVMSKWRSCVPIRLTIFYDGRERMQYTTWQGGLNLRHLTALGAHPRGDVAREDHHPRLGQREHGRPHQGGQIWLRPAHAMNDVLSPVDMG